VKMEEQKRLAEEKRRLEEERQSIAEEQAKLRKEKEAILERPSNKITRGWLGFSIQDISEDIAKSLKLKERRGTLIVDVFKGQPADKAGLKSGDIITEIDGKAVKDSHELLIMIAGFRVGDKVNVKILRDEQEKAISVTIEERRDQAEIATFHKSGEAFGMTVNAVTPEVAQNLGLSIKTGVIVTDVKAGSTADVSGILRQDIILQVNKVKISSLTDYIREIGNVGEKGSILLLIKRGKATFFVSMRK
jgi:serine protease Do